MSENNGVEQPADNGVESQNANANNGVEQGADNGVESQPKEQNAGEEADLSFLNGGDAAAKPGEEAPQQSEAEKILEGQVNSASQKIENSEINPATKKPFEATDFDAYLQGKLQDVKPKQANIDVEQIIKQATDAAVNQVNSQNQETKNKADLVQLQTETKTANLSSVEGVAMKNEFNQLIVDGVNPARAGRIAFDKIRAQRVLDGKSRTDVLDGMGDAPQADNLINYSNSGTAEQKLSDIKDDNVWLERSNKLAEASKAKR